MKKIILLGSVVVLLYAPVVFAAANLGSLQESIGVGKVLSLALSQSATGHWYVTSNSSAATASASISSGNLVVTGVAVGQAAIFVCTETAGVNCLQLAVTVTMPQQNGSVLGATITSAHPVGTWVLQDKTVYYVSAAGLIPVSTPQIFLGNGGQWKRLQPINSGDLALPLEPLMTLHDSRVQ